MKKLLYVVLVIFAVTGNGWAEEIKKFSDVPEGHWAEGSINDLAKLGLTGGYPDGTFRGKQPVTRYETASLLSKLAKTQSDDNLNELKNEIRSLKGEVNSLKSTGLTVVDGSFQAISEFGNLLSNREDSVGKGPLLGYRIVTAVEKKYGDGNSLRINLDTMDSGLSGNDQNVGMNIIDAVGTLKMDLIDWGLESPLNLRVAAGPGPVTYLDATGILRPTSGETYVRERPSVKLATNLFGFDVSGGYIAQSVSNNGLANVSRVDGSISKSYDKDSTFPGMVLGLDARYLRSPGAMEIDRQLDLWTKFSFDRDIDVSFRLGMGASRSVGWLYKASLDLNDNWKTGTVINLSATKVNPDYFNPAMANDLAGYDLFNRPLGLGITDVGINVAQIITEKIKVYVKSDLKLSADYHYGSGYPESRLTSEGGLSYDIAPSTIYDVYYRVDQIPSAKDPTVDMLFMALKYNF